MRVDIFVPTVSEAEQVRFYVEELRLFKVAHDYGMGCILLAHVTEPGVCLQLMPDQKPIPERPLFCLATDDCEREFSRLRGVSFTKGGLMTASGPSSVLEYPLGKTFGLTDASGNVFAVAQWRPAAA